MTPLPWTVERPDLLLAERLVTQQQIRMLTPYWRIGSRVARWGPARRIWKAAMPFSQYTSAPVPLAASVVLGIPPYLIFVVWMIQRVSDVASVDFQWRMWVAGIWILVSPALITEWERRFLTLHGVMIDTAPDDGWDVGRLVRVDAIAAKLWYSYVGVTGILVPVGYLLSRDFFRQRTGPVDVDDVYFWIGLIIIVMLGISFGVGNWGIAKTLVYSWNALDREISWNPFKPRQVAGFEALSFFAYSTGLLYSLGAVFLPGVYEMIPDLPIGARFIGIAIAAVLICGGSAVFILPSIWIHRVAKAQRDSALESYSKVLTDLNAAVLVDAPGVDFAAMSNRVSAIACLRSLIATQRTSPSAVWLGTRVFALFLLPLIVSAAQAVVGLK
ncbi:hypothetical protein [Actinoplanes sp. NPDC020271]|uniref:hypothetical protein n=1 Tax=Actinoplanes sp. NPDC020271 TaxID=3363896 RepID=UPI0037A3F100